MAIEFNPKPAGDYNTLLQQFNSLLRLHNGNANQVALLRSEVAGLLTKLGMMSPGEVDSQRDANAELTALLEQQEVKLSDKDKDLIRLRNALAQSNRERDALREEVMGTAGPAYRAAADIYYQLIQECEIPEGGSLVNYIDNLRDSARDLIDVFTGMKGGMTKQQAMEALGYALDASNQGKDTNG